VVLIKVTSATWEEKGCTSCVGRVIEQTPKIRSNTTYSKL
jgi:hypothetical protein